MGVFPLLCTVRKNGVKFDVAIVVVCNEMRSRTQFEVNEGNSGDAFTFYLFYNIHGKSLWYNENIIIKPTVGLVSRMRCCCIHEILYTRDVN